jgi:Na+/melibiose symporter-like transporter
VRTFAMKATSGIGGMIGGFGLDLVQFPKNAVVGQVNEGALHGLLFMSGPLYWMIVAAGMGFMAMYQLTEVRHREILRVLNERRSLAQSP